MTTAAIIATALALGQTVVPQAEVREVAACVTQMSGLPLPETLPVVIRSREWTFDLYAVCCNSTGDRGHTLRAKSGAIGSARGSASYTWSSRRIDLAASATVSHLAHELAVDMAAQKLIAVTGRGLLSAERHRLDEWAYDIETRYRFEDCAND